jgi:hypothetical protein
LPGLLLVLFGILYVMLRPPTGDVLGLVMLPLGLLLLFQKYILVWRSAKASFKGQKREKFDFVLKATDDGIEFGTEFGHATSTWEGFVDSRVHIDGVLLYPQRFRGPLGSKTEPGSTSANSSRATSAGDTATRPTFRRKP